jgi:CarD family transcriptional regulator
MNPAAEELNLSFKIGDKVVYPNHGVSIVEGIGSGFETASIPPRDDLFYHLRVLSNNSRVMVPVPNSEKIGLRKLSKRKDVNELMALLADSNVTKHADWKGRYKTNLDKMKSGRLEDVADVLKNLSYVRLRKSLSFREKKMYERARYLIVSEIAVVSGREEQDVEKLVDKALDRALGGGMPSATRKAPLDN